MKKRVKKTLLPIFSPTKMLVGLLAIVAISFTGCANEAVTRLEGASLSADSGPEEGSNANDANELADLNAPPPLPDQTEDPITGPSQTEDIPTTLPTLDQENTDTNPDIIQDLQVQFTPQLDGRGVYEISDRFFATQIHGILIDSDNFLGRSIRMSGMFLSSFWEATEEYFHFVARFGEGCCAPGDFLGFEIYLNGLDPLPDDTWVEFTGILEEYYVANLGNVLRLVGQEMIEIEPPPFA